jgi:uncharacterized protein (TIGR03437 family)
MRLVHVPVCRRLAVVFSRLAIASLLFSSFCHAQPQAVVIGAGYAAPSFIDVAPGQIITIFARVPGKTPADAVVASAPLPAELVGFSVLLRQTFPSDPQQVPILSVSDSQTCSIVAPLLCDTVSMITVQVPFELTPNAPRGGGPQTTVPQNFARLEISYNGNPANSLFLNPVLDRIHVLNTCDAAANLSPPRALACLPMVARPDGSLVSSENPAQAGEVLTVSVVGLGPALTSVPTGIATPILPPAVDGVVVALDTRANASPGLPSPATSSPAKSAHLKAGAVGIYQVMFTVPSLPADAPACSSSVRSNLTIDIGRTTSYDGVGICVVPPAPPAEQ